MPETSTSSNAVEFSDSSIGFDCTGWKRDSAEDPVYAVVSAVAEVLNEDPLELPPLNEVVNPEALNALFTSRPGITVDSVEFQYAGCEVAVLGDGGVQVEPVREA